MYLLYWAEETQGDSSGTESPKQLSTLSSFPGSNLDVFSYLFSREISYRRTSPECCEHPEQHGSEAGVCLQQYLVSRITHLVSTVFSSMEKAVQNLGAQYMDYWSILKSWAHP